MTTTTTSKKNRTTIVDEKELKRSMVPTLLDTITKAPEFVFSATGPRRTPLYKRRDPDDNFTDGAICYHGENIEKNTRVCMVCNHVNPLTGKGSMKCAECGARKADAKVILEDAGTIRTQVVKGKNNDRETKAWRPPDNENKHFLTRDELLERGLYRVYGMYQLNSRYENQRRAFVLIDIRTVLEIVYMGIKYTVVED